MRTVAALYVDPAGIYSTMPGVDPWGEARDARLYEGPHSVVAHPPCGRWSRFWASDGSETPGQDGGCFASALNAVVRFGGVLEHPEASHAWAAFDLPPAAMGSWSRGLCGGWSTCVSQRNYGHRARKLTWLYYMGYAPPPLLDWKDPGSGGVYLSQPGRCRSDKPRKTCGCKRCETLYGEQWQGASRRIFDRMTTKENAATPAAFASLLVDMARSAGARHG